MRRALVLGCMLVLFVAWAGAGQTLTGSWDTDIVVDPLKTQFTDTLALTSVVTLNYALGDWHFITVSTFSGDGWTDQDFKATGVLGSFSINTALDLNPNATFGDWSTTVQATLYGIVMGATFKLDGTDAYLTLTGRGGMGTPVSVDITAGFGSATPAGCDLDFSYVTIGVDFTFCECAPIQSEFKFDCEGFLYAKFVTTGIAIPNLPWLTIGATLEFLLDAKTLTLSPTFDFGATVCFDLHFDVDPTGNVTVPAIRVDGIGIACTIDGVKFAAFSYWGNDGKPGLLSGTDYWEVYSIGTSNDDCCGPFGFDVAVYFLEKGIRLFDVGLIDADLTLRVASQFTVDMGLEINLETAAFTKWTLGFLVTW